MQAEEILEAMLTQRKLLLWIPPGMGKTSLAVSALQRLDPDRILVLAPLSLHQWWERNLIGFRDYRVATYDADYLDYKSDVVILDESVLVKNRKSKRYARFLAYQMAHRPTYVWLLSGNPISRFADDLWAQLHLLYPKLYPSYWRFAEKYCYVHQDQWGVHVVGNRVSVEELRSLPGLLWSEKIYELPFPDLEFVEYRIAIDADTRNLCRQAYKNLVLGKYCMTNAVSAMVRINQTLSDPRLLGLDLPTHKINFLQDYYANLEKPVVVFTNFRQDLEVRTALIPGRKTYLTGDVPPQERQAIIDAINAGEFDIAFFTPGVGRFGFSLPNVPNILFWDLPLIYDHFYQAVYRARRVNSSLSVSKVGVLLTDFPMERKLWELLKRKSRFSLWEFLQAIRTEKVSV